MCDTGLDPGFGVRGKLAIKDIIETIDKNLNIDYKVLCQC